MYIYFGILERIHHGKTFNGSITKLKHKKNNYCLLRKLKALLKAALMKKKNQRRETKTNKKSVRAHNKI